MYIPRALGGGRAKRGEGWLNVDEHGGGRAKRGEGRGNVDGPPPSPHPPPSLSTLRTLRGKSQFYLLLPGIIILLDIFMLHYICKQAGGSKGRGSRQDLR